MKDYPPHVTFDNEDGSIDFWWAFGPQGHPASMRVHILIETNHAVHIWAFGPWSEHKITDDVPLTAIPALLEYGAAIEEEFGHDWKWHKCMPDKNCPRTCPDCNRIRDRERARTRAWVTSHPPPGGKG